MGAGEGGSTAAGVVGKAVGVPVGTGEGVGTGGGTVGRLRLGPGVAAVVVGSGRTAVGDGDGESVAVSGITVGTGLLHATTARVARPRTDERTRVAV